LTGFIESLGSPGACAAPVERSPVNALRVLQAEVCAAT
jgi:hypothetical protein